MCVCVGEGDGDLCIYVDLMSMRIFALKMKKIFYEL